MTPSALTTSYVKTLSDHSKHLPIAFQGRPGDPEVWEKHFVEIWVSSLVYLLDVYLIAFFSLWNKYMKATGDSGPSTQAFALLETVRSAFEQSDN